MANEYSKLWFEVFMKGKNVSDTEIEVNFLKKHLPISNYKKILDLCCGYGRHSNMLGKYGYNVLGIDRDEDALIKAEELSNKNVEYLSYDMRNIEKLPYSFDGIISMWHSFGYFNDEVNNSIIRQISSLLNKNGRFILDIYNKDFFEKNVGKREFTKENLLIKEEVKKEGNRFNVTLSYDNTNIIDEFNWYLYSKDEITNLCKEYSLICKTACIWHDEGQAIDENAPRMQLVFEKN